jgi:anti-anti-sigma factor
VPYLTAALVPAPDQVVVRLVGDADVSTASTVANALSRAAGLGTRQVVVDVAAARFTDCSGLHELADFTGDLAAAGRACRIVGALPATRRLIGMANLTGRLQLDGVPDRNAIVPADGGTDADGVPTLCPVGGHPVFVRGALATAVPGR